MEDEMMEGGVIKKMMYINRTAPYGTIYALEALEVVLIGAALGTLLVLAFNQFQLYGRHEAIISQTERILFQYSNIREQIVADIVEGQAGNITRVSPAVEELTASCILVKSSGTLMIAENKLCESKNNKIINCHQFI